MTTGGWWETFFAQEQRAQYTRDRFNAIQLPASNNNFNVVYQQLFNVPVIKSPTTTAAAKKPCQEVIVSKVTRMTAQMRTAYKITKLAHLRMAQGRRMPFLVRTLRICKTLQRSKVTGEWSLERVL